MELIEDKTHEELKELESLKIQYNMLIEEYRKTINSNGSITNKYGTFIEIEYSIFEMVLNEQKGRQIVYSNGDFSFLDIPEGIKIEYTKDGFVETATLEEQEEFYRNKIINLNNRITELESIGLGANKLKIELEKLKLKHQEVTYLLALKIDKIIA